jgi:transposase
MRAKAQKGKPSADESTPGAPADDLPERWSVQRKAELVLRVLRGEALDAVSRESQIPAHELERWHRIFRASADCARGPRRRSASSSWPAPRSVS